MQPANNPILQSTHLIANQPLYLFNFQPIQILLHLFATLSSSTINSYQGHLSPTLTIHPYIFPSPPLSPLQKITISTYLYLSLIQSPSFIPPKQIHYPLSPPAHPPQPFPLSSMQTNPHPPPLTDTSQTPLTYNNLPILHPQQGTYNLHSTPHSYSHSPQSHPTSYTSSHPAPSPSSPTYHQLLQHHPLPPLSTLPHPPPNFFNIIFCHPSHPSLPTLPHQPPTFFNITFCYPHPPSHPTH